MIEKMNYLHLVKIGISIKIILSMIGMINNMEIL